MRRFGLALALLSAVAPHAAFAQAGVNESVAVIATSTSSGSGGCLAQDQYRKSLTFDNSGGTINIGYCLGATCTAVIGAPPTTTILAGQIHYWPTPSAPSAAFCFISASGTPSITIKEGK